MITLYQEVLVNNYNMRVHGSNIHYEVSSYYRLVWLICRFNRLRQYRLKPITKMLNMIIFFFYFWNFRTIVYNRWLISVVTSALVPIIGLECIWNVTFFTCLTMNMILATRASNSLWLEEKRLNKRTQHCYN